MTAPGESGRALHAAYADTDQRWDGPVNATMTTPHVYAKTDIPPDPASQDPNWPDRWPFMSHLELAALDTAPGCARGHVAAVLREWRMAVDKDEAILIVSELVTNAMLSTKAEKLPDPVHLWMLGDGISVVFLVWDATMPAPVLASAAVTALHGRGLTLVDTLSARWGYYYPNGQTRGKVVWSLMHATL
jgi:hypothetical protein